MFVEEHLKANFCNASSVPTVFTSDFSKYLTIGCLSVIPIATIVGNILVIFTVIQRGKFHQRTYVFVISLAIADLLVGILVMPLSLFHLYRSGSQWYNVLNDHHICVMSTSFDVMFTTTSILHLMCMTIDRYLAVAYPLKYSRLMNRTFVILLLLLCWMISAILSFGLIFGDVHHIGIDKTEVACSAMPCALEVNIWYAVFGSIVAFYVPSVFMVLCNIKLYLVVKKRKEILNSLTSAYVSSAMTERQIQTEVKVARTIAILLSCFFVCWLPFFLWNVIGHVVHADVSDTVGIVLDWLGDANSCINPYLFYFLTLPHKTRE